MARRRRRLLLIPALLAAVYLAAYAWFRINGDIVHYRGFGPIAHDIRAPRNAWDELLVDMLAATDSIKLNAAAMVLEKKAKRINWVFYPLRRAEAWVWNSHEVLMNKVHAENPCQEARGDLAKPKRMHVKYA